MAIVHQPRVAVRLHMLLWHLADRWGRVRPDGIPVSLQLTHAVLADVIAAQRPSVSVALSELAKQDRVRSVKGGWLLSGERPVELLELRTSPMSGSNAAGSGRDASVSSDGVRGGARRSAARSR